MTPEQALVASNGSLQQCTESVCKGQSNDNEVAKLYGQYQSGEFDFTVFMLFDKSANTLSVVSLTLNSPEKEDALIGALRKKYGEPSSNNKTAITNAIAWQNEKDMISLFEIGSDLPIVITQVTLSYYPRLDASNKGL